MKYFPMFIKVDQHPVLIVGGGEQATQKCRLLLKTSAKIIVAADDLDPELLHLVSERKINAIPMVEAVHRLRDAVLVFVATGCRGADAGFAYCASSLGRVVNVVDQPALCGAITPSIVDRDPVVVAIGTEGTAPILGRTLKARIEESLEPRLGELAELAGRLRAEVGLRFDARERRSLWRWVFGGAPRAAFARGEQREAIRMIKDAIAGRTRADKSLGRISIVATSTDSADLLTLRAAQRLHIADEVFFDGDVSKDERDVFDAEEDVFDAEMEGFDAEEDVFEDEMEIFGAEEDIFEDEMEVLDAEKDDATAGMILAENESDECDDDDEVARPVRRVRNVVDSDNDGEAAARAVHPPGTMAVFDKLAPGDIDNPCEFQIKVNTVR